MSVTVIEKYNAMEAPSRAFMSNFTVQKHPCEHERVGQPRSKGSLSSVLEKGGSSLETRLRVGLRA